MTAPLLALDCLQCKITGILTLYEPKSGQSFAFADLSTLQAFCAFYYRNPVAALFAYHALRHAKSRPV